MVNHQPNGITIRPLQKRDNEAISDLIKQVLIEHGAAKPGTAYFDQNLDRLFETFSHPGAAYFVAIKNHVVIGGAGIFPTRGLPENYCELVKLYLHQKARGTGTGYRLMKACFSTAGEIGYTHIYLETMPELHKAVQFYERFGFKYLTHALGQSGHFNCSIRMLCAINQNQ